jgi:hypothetical protein
LLGGLRLFSHGAINTGAIGNSGLEAHNLFLATLYDYGIIGLTLLILMFVALAVGLIAGMRKASGDHHTLFVVAFLTLFNVFVQSFEQTDLFFQTIGVYFFVVMALPFAHCWSESGAPATPPGASPGRAALRRDWAGRPASGRLAAQEESLTRTMQRWLHKENEPIERLDQ